MSRNKREDGAILLTTLMIMSLMAMVAVAIMDDIHFAVKRAVNVQDYAQADWYARGAEDFAQSYLTDQLAKTEVEAFNNALQTGLPVALPIDGGVIALSVRDGTQCFSLGALKKSENSEDKNNLIFRLFLTALGWSDRDAGRFISVVIDWQDKDTQISPDGAEDYHYLGLNPPYRAANTVFGSMTELRALDIVSEKQYQSLRPYLCARGDNKDLRLNINTLSVQQAPLLAAVLGSPEALSTAVELIQNRPAAGYDIETLKAAPPLQNFAYTPNYQHLSFAPEYIWVEASISYKSATRIMAFEFAIENGRVELIYRGFGDEILRPQLITKEPET